MIEHASGPKLIGDIIYITSCGLMRGLTVHLIYVDSGKICVWAKSFHSRIPHH